LDTKEIRPTLCSVGISPTATINHMPMLADSTEYFGVFQPGLKLAVIAA
jgi:hypothetical protein